MKLTPLDIHHKEFRTSLRGYNQEEVDAFLDEVADEFERLFKENIDLSEKLDASNERIRSYADMEKTLHNTLLAAQQSAEEIQGKSRKEAELLLRDAEIKAKEMIAGALAEKQRATVDYQRIKQAEDEFRMHFRNLLDEYLKRMHAIDTPADVAEIMGVAEEKMGEINEQAERVAAQQPERPAVPATAAPSAPAPEPEAAPRPSAARPPAPEPAPEAVAAPTARVSEGPAEPTQDDSDRSRPQARAGRRRGGRSAPDAQPDPGATVQSLTLGEVEGPDLGPEPPEFGEPGEFLPGGVHGEHDEDLDIEQID